MAECIGLDIGSTSIKAVQVKLGRKSARLLAFGIEPLPAETIVDGAIMNQSSVVEAIGRLRETLGVRTKNVATAVSGHSVIIKKIQLAAMASAELAEQIPFEAEQHIPFKRDEVELDYHVINPRNAQGRMELILVAAKKETIGDYIQVIREARLNPVVMDVAAFSVQNAFECAYPESSAGTVALVNVGGVLSNINIVTAGTSVFTRDVTVGGAAFTDELQKRLGVPVEDAEQFKIAACDGITDGVPEAVKGVLEEVAESTAGKLQRSLDFFLSATTDATVSRIYLCGGSAKIPALAKSLESRAHIPVELLQPFRGTEVDAEKFDPGFLKAHGPEAAVAMGLALRRPGDRPS